MNLADSVFLRLHNDTFLVNIGMSIVVQELAKNGEKSSFGCQLWGLLLCTLLTQIRWNGAPKAPLHDVICTPLLRCPTASTTTTTNNMNLNWVNAKFNTKLATISQRLDTLLRSRNFYTCFKKTRLSATKPASTRLLFLNLTMARDRYQINKFLVNRIKLSSCCYRCSPAITLLLAETTNLLVIALLPVVSKISVTYLEKLYRGEVARFQS